MRVLILNVWNREGPWERRLPLLQRWLQRLGADLMGFQEVRDADHVREICGTQYHVAVWRAISTVLLYLLATALPSVVFGVVEAVRAYRGA